MTTVVAVLVVHPSVAHRVQSSVWCQAVHPFTDAHLEFVAGRLNRRVNDRQPLSGITDVLGCAQTGDIVSPGSETSSLIRILRTGVQVGGAATPVLRTAWGETEGRPAE